MAQNLYFIYIFLYQRHWNQCMGKMENSLEKREMIKMAKK